jgi:hypothetical protein
MDKRTINVSLAPDVTIGQISGNLEIKGWERPEVAVYASPSTLDLEELDDGVRLSCTGNCEIRLPTGTAISVESVGGEAYFKQLEDDLSIGKVNGSLGLRSVGNVDIDQVKGHLEARAVSGDLRAKSVLGHAEIRDVQGDCFLDSVKGHLDLRNVEGGIQANVAGHARLRLGILAGAEYNIQASGDLECRIPEDASLRLKLASKEKVIRIKLPGQSQTLELAEYEMILGRSSADDGEVKMTLSAGGEIYLRTQESEWGESGSQPGAAFGTGNTGIPEDFGQQVARQVEAQIHAQMQSVTRQMDEQMSRLSELMNRTGLSAEETERILEQARQTGERESTLAQERLRRAQEKLERKLEATRQREEQRAKAAERRSQGREGSASRHGKHVWSFQWPNPPTPPAPPNFQAPKAGKAVNAAATEEERLIILRMLEQKKINLKQAEQLLSALEGKE